MFTVRQIEEILEVIRRNHLVYIGVNVGTDMFNDYDKWLLKKYGIDVDKLTTQFNPTEQAFYWGRLSQVLGEQQAKQVTYQNFIKYLKKGQYIPLSKREKGMLEVAKNRTYEHIKGLGDKISDYSKSQILEEKNRRIISEETQAGISERKSKSSIMREIGNKTDEWQRDLGRIVDTEYNTIMQDGRAAVIMERNGGEAMVYKDTYPGACRHCIRLHLTGGIGSKPIVIPLKQAIENGTNIGKKVADWKFVVGSVHPWCRCNLFELEEGKVWSEEKKDFVYPDKYESKIRTSKIKTYVGNQIFYS